MSAAPAADLQMPAGKPAEQVVSALRDCERRLAATQALARVGDWTLERDTARMTWSAELFRMFERNPEHGVPDLNEMFAYLSAESLERTRSAFWDAIDHGCCRTLEQEVLLPSGRPACYVTEIVPVADAAGRVYLLYGTVQDITERKKLETERVRHLARAAELSRHLITVGEHERRQLALALHDRASPNLAALKLIFANLRRTLPPNTAAEFALLLEDADALLADTEAGIRTISVALRPVMLDHGGLLGAIGEFARQVSRHANLDIAVVGDDPGELLSAEQQTMLFRIAQEAVTNSVKHSAASEIRIVLRCRQHGVLLRISDNGRGLDGDPAAHRSRSPGLGLVTMRERTELAGGRFNLISSPDSGTTIEVTLAAGALDAGETR